ncbi:MAG: phospholipase D family protein [Thermodesulfobacteriota bacterium]
MKNSKRYKLAMLLVFALFVSGCATVSFDQPKSYSQAITDPEETSLGEYAAFKVEEQEGLSGFYPLNEGLDALGMRLRLAETAEKSLDLQYFLMKSDDAGAVIATALLKAADRGVRVRFLLDDIFTTVPDDSFLLINQHPNIEIRIFNPISRSGISTLNFVRHFKQANRRMHNKSFTADNVVSIVGGRNIADEYFELKTDSVFIDFDVLAVGPIVTEISDSFDEYWNHSRAVPIDQFIEDNAREDLSIVRAEIAEEFDEIYDTVYKKAFNSQLMVGLVNDQQPLFAAPARVLADSPDKLVNEVNETHMRLANDLGEVIRTAEKEVIFISPYYVPGDGGVQLARELVEKGLRVVVLTNSLASNNHVPVHAAYARYRRDVIGAGVELYEIRANAARELNYSEDGPEKLTLHTKVFIIDRKKIFVGSLNLDPRSIRLNAEMGLLIDSEAMVASLFSKDEEDLRTNAYRVLVNDKGDLEWHCIIDNQKVIETKEPLTSRWLRFKAWFMKIAPESQL